MVLLLHPKDNHTHNGNLLCSYYIFKASSHGVYGVHGAVKPLGGLVCGKLIDVQGPQDLIAPVDRLPGIEEELGEVVHAL